MATWAATADLWRKLPWVKRMQHSHATSTASTACILQECERLGSQPALRGYSALGRQASSRLVSYQPNSLLGFGTMALGLSTVTAHALLQSHFETRNKGQDHK